MTARRTRVRDTDPRSRLAPLAHSAAPDGAARLDGSRRLGIRRA
jgi:hypothetical protein